MFFFKFKTISCIACLCSLFSIKALANVDDFNVCLYNTYKIEKELGIRENLLSTIALVESGRYSPRKSIGYSWPWTVSYKGKGFYFDTKKEAVNKIKELQKKGMKSIDVGCMQINLFYHDFPSVEDAINPEKNIKYAANFIKKLYNKHGTWGAAATTFHSHNPKNAYLYENRLINIWNKLDLYLENGGALFDGYNNSLNLLSVSAFKKLEK